jgi:predicted nuclease of predicted toxin-antitoxin system
MRFLADECLHVEIVVALRRTGHEVATIAPADAGASDEAVLERAAREHAIVLTADKDFGAIAIRRAGASPGIVLFRRSVIDPAGVTACLLALIQEHGELLHDLYAVITPGRSRVRRLDAPEAED